MSRNSGTSSRKASWPRSVSISANDTRALDAFSACTSARDSEVGNSQSLVKETTQKRVSIPANAFASTPPWSAGDVEIVHRARQIEIGVGVEALDEGRALVAQIALDLEIGVEREGRQLAVLHAAAELAMQRGVREIGDVRGHARDREAAMRMDALIGVAPLCQSGSAITAWRPSSWKAMFCAECRVEQAIASAE